MLNMERFMYTVSVPDKFLERFEKRVQEPCKTFHQLLFGDFLKMYQMKHFDKSYE